jgi:hypothetical protein
MVTHDSRAERFVDSTYRLDKGVFVGAENSVLSSGFARTNPESRLAGGAE